MLFRSGDARGRPIHGLVHDRPWRVVERSGERIEIRFRLSADAPDALERWPADFTLAATWRLSPTRLDLDLDLLAHGTMPAALGLHPYHPLPVVPGADPRDAAIEVRGPTMFGELIIAVVYLPILFLEGTEGKLFRPMALTVLFALLGSLVISLTLMPVLDRKSTRLNSSH